MKNQRRCESDQLFISMARQVSEVGEWWPAMDAFLRILDSCNRCSIRDCPGMLADGMRDEGQQQIPEFSMLVESMRIPIQKIPVPTAADEQRTISSLLALANPLPGSNCGFDAAPAQSHGLPKQAAVEPQLVYGDRSALARLFGWSVTKKGR